MSTTPLDCPVFDADNHLYETKDALTKHLPDRFRGAIDYAEIRGRTKILVRGQVSEYIPNPDLRRRGPARRPGGLLPAGQPGGQEPARDLRRAHPSHPGVPRARASPRADGRAGSRPGLDVPDPGQPGRRAHEGRCRAHPRRSSTPSTSGCTRPGPSTTKDASSPPRSSRFPSSSGPSRSSTGSPARGPGGPDPSGTSPRLARVEVLRTYPSSIRSGSES